MAFKARQKLGKYRIEGCIARGPLTAVYRASDPVMGIQVALKIPRSGISPSTLEDFHKEVRLAVRLQHENVLPVLDAREMDGHFVMVTPLGKETLGDRLERRLATSTALDLAEQAIAAVAHAHSMKIIHCDIKPENFILFPDNHLRLADFAFAKKGQRTVKASGSGTLGYIAPEQAMGRPVFQSDVFALGLVFYKMFSGKLPEWPYDWPPAGFDRLKQRAHPDLIEFIRKSIQVKPADRFRDAMEMQIAFAKVKSPSRQPKGKTRTPPSGTPVWQTPMSREFLHKYGKVLEARHACRHCQAPVSESMQFCPWCGEDNPSQGSETRFPAHCPRCQRGVKLDWEYCAWCYGGGFEKENDRHYSDVRYSAHCGCSSRSPLMPFMKYCPWCRKKVQLTWQIPGNRQRCKKCENGVLTQYWEYCPWCRHKTGGK
jgi:serine/threonine protein kinase